VFDREDDVPDGRGRAGAEKLELLRPSRVVFDDDNRIRHWLRRIVCPSGELELDDLDVLRALGAEGLVELLTKLA
jgi:hypothetical protein